MKQLTCEMCGSTDLMKQDGVFVCQTCGCKYSVEEAKKLFDTTTVVVDNSKQMENDLKRAKQFENEGDDYTAMDYYNKVLDINADNEEAIAGVNRLKSKDKYSEYYVIEPTISSEKGVENFLKGLKETEHITSDIYGNIKIKSVVEKFYNFAFFKAHGDAHWTAIRCDEHTENETVYKKEYRDGRTVQVPETKKVTKVERTPVSGSRQWRCQKLLFPSNALIESLGEQSNRFVQELNDEIIERQNKRYGEYETHHLDTRKIIENENESAYVGIDLNLEYDISIATKITDVLINNEVDRAFQGALPSGLNTYYENIDSHYTTASKTIAQILIPIQIIHYEYKNNEYVAVSEMIAEEDNGSSFIQTIPADKELHDSKTEMEEEKTKLEEKAEKERKTGNTICKFSILGIVIVLIGSFFDSDVIMITGLVCFFIGGIVGVPIFVKSRVTEKKLNNMLSEWSECHKKIQEPKKKFLLDSANAFFEQYNGLNSVEAATQSVKAKLPLNENNETVIVISGLNNENTVSESGNGYTLKLISIGEDKIQAIKIIREITGLGLAEAKQICDSIPSDISVASSDKADKLIERLTSIGANIE